MANKNLIFLGGIPLAPDIKKLEQEFGVPREGQEIQWEQMERTLGMSRKTHRFQSVYSAWKRRLFKDHNAVMTAIGSNQGVKVLSPDERIVHAVELSEQGGRKIRQAIVISELTDTKRLSNPELVKAQLSVSKLREVRLEIYRHVQPKQLPSASEALGMS